jgi:hypothetical protein
MNIDYAAIIAKANVRKDALQRFEALLPEVRAAYEAFPAQINLAERINHAVQALDDEAKSLIGYSSCRALIYMASALCAHKMNLETLDVRGNYGHTPDPSNKSHAAGLLKLWADQL